MTTHPEIFDRHGNIAADIDPAAVEAMDDGLRAILMSTLADARAAEAADQHRIECRTAVNVAIRAHDAALAADHIKNPPVSFQDAQLAVINRNRPDYKPPKHRVHAKAREALATAIEVLASARSALTIAEDNFRLADKARSTAVQKWIDAIPRVTQETIHREMVAKDQARRMDIAMGRVPAPVVVEPVREHEIDRVLASRGKTANRLPQYHSKR